MIVVVSQAFTKDADESARAYREASRAFLSFMEAAPGFRRRVLLQGLEDPTHFTHLRWFEQVSDYEALTQRPGYQAHIDALSLHLDLARYAGTRGREYMDVVLEP